MTREAPPFEIPILVGAAQTLHSEQATALVLAPEAYSNGALLRVRAKVRENTPQLSEEPGSVLVPMSGREDLALTVRGRGSDLGAVSSMTGRSVDPTRWDVEFWLAINTWEAAPFRLCWPATGIDGVLDSVRPDALRDAAARVPLEQGR